MGWDCCHFLTAVWSKQKSENLTFSDGLTKFDGIKPFKCEICHITFSNKSHLSNHVESKHEGKKPSFKCSVCTKKFTTNGGLISHISLVHERKIPSRCEICNVETKALKHHIQSVNEGKKNHFCNICSYSSFQKGAVDSHILSVHEGQKPYICDLCNRSRIPQNLDCRLKEVFYKSERSRNIKKP